MVKCLQYHGITEDRYRSLAYEKAVAALRSLPYKVKNVSELTETIDLGQANLNIIDELLTKGDNLLK